MNSVSIPAPPTSVAIPAPPTFSGQWMGFLYGETPGVGVVELEMENGFITGTAYLHPTDQQIVPAAVRVSFPATLGSHSLSDVPVLPFAPDYGRVISREEMAVLYKDSDVSETADITLSFNGSSLFVHFKTALTTGFGNLTLAHSNPSGLQARQMSWSEFSDHALKWPNIRNFVFRGQPDPRPLRSSFHRSSRKNLERYNSLAVPEAYAALGDNIDKLNLNDPIDRGCLYSTLQHHGYPTPLLDWSKSPWVAAYFAFEHAKPETHSVRIFAMDRASWMNTYQLNHLTMTRPHFSFIDLSQRGNNRPAPQQSVFTMTTVDDIEAHVLATEKRYDRSYLWAIDIPTPHREEALIALDVMGINRANLFPGRDGICKTMKVKHFGLD